MYFTLIQNTNLQPLTHKISTAHHTIENAFEFLYPMPTVQMRKCRHSDSYLQLMMT